MAGVMAIGMSAPTYASTTACDHFGKIYTQEIEPHYTYEQHPSTVDPKIICTKTTKYRTFVTGCITCGTLGSSSHTEVSHSVSGCKG